MLFLAMKTAVNLSVVENVYSLWTTPASLISASSQVECPWKLSVVNRNKSVKTIWVLDIISMVLITIGDSDPQPTRGTRPTKSHLATSVLQ